MYLAQPLARDGYSLGPGIPRPCRLAQGGARAENGLLLGEKDVRIAKRKVFEAVRGHCLAKRGAVEEYPWESVVWKVGGHLFAIGALGENAFTVKSTPADQSVLTQIPGVEAAAYVGRFGWVTVTVTDTQGLALARLLIDLSYDLVARRSRPRSRHPNGPRPARTRSRPRSRR